MTDKRYIYCAQCRDEKPPGILLADYQQLEVESNPAHYAVCCRRHRCVVAMISALDEGVLVLEVGETEIITDDQGKLTVGDVFGGGS